MISIAARRSLRNGSPLNRLIKLNFVLGPSKIILDARYGDQTEVFVPGSVFVTDTGEIIELKDVKISVKHIKEAKRLKLSTNKYVDYLKNLTEKNKTRSEELELQRLEKVEGMLSNLIQSLTSKDIAERSLVLKLEKDLKQLLISNNQLQELILSKFEFINALQKELSK